MPARPLDTVVFDLGGVLLDWNPRYLYRQLLPDDASIETFLLEVGFAEWNATLDAGRSWGDAVEELAARHPHRRALIEAFHERWPETLGAPIEGTLAVLAELRGAGVRVVALSNWSAETFPVARARFEFLDWFEGIVLSGEVRVNKPDPRIFAHLVERFALEPATALFVDDSAANVEAARRLGFHAVLFSGADALRAELVEHGLLADWRPPIAGDGPRGLRGGRSDPRRPVLESRHPPRAHCRPASFRPASGRLGDDAMQHHAITLLGTGLIGDFYTMTLHGQRGADRVRVVYSRSGGRGEAFRERWGIPESTTDLEAAIRHPETDVVVVALPNHLHEAAVKAVAAAGKAVLCTKPLGRNADEAQRMLEAVERAGVFAGYLEDLCYTPKTLKAIKSVEDGQLGAVTWVRSRETHPGPHSAWFWDGRLTGGGAIIDLGCHCIEIIRNFVGKGNRPVEVMCTTDTLVHPIEDEDNAIALIRFESGAIGQFEVSWTFRGGMDLRDEVAGTHGTIWLNHFLRTGYEMFTAGGSGGYVAEKAETAAGWLFPVGDEVSELGYVDMFTDMFNAIDRGAAPRETFYDGYVVNAVMDAAYRSAKTGAWEPVALFEWRGGSTPRITAHGETFEGYTVIKREVLPDGRVKMILKDATTGDYLDRVIAGG